MEVWRFYGEDGEFLDEDRTPEENAGPHLIVVDGFYQDPYLVRQAALAAEYRQYSPPLPELVPNIADVPEHVFACKGKWLSTVLTTFRGVAVREPYIGFRHLNDDLRVQFEQLIEHRIDLAGWQSAEHDLGTVHHHWRKGDTYPRGWSGVVYLSPDAPASSGTSIWRSNRTQKLVAKMGNLYEYDEKSFECALVVLNRFNRLVLFRENVLHKAEKGFGALDGRRLTQTFFFPIDLQASTLNAAQRT